jgi:hypothetical protein
LGRGRGFQHDDPFLVGRDAIRGDRAGAVGNRVLTSNGAVKTKQNIDESQDGDDPLISSLGLAERFARSKRRNLRTHFFARNVLIFHKTPKNKFGKICRYLERHAPLRQIEARNASSVAPAWPIFCLSKSARSCLNPMMRCNM